jgi:hypothetical protein
LQRRPASPKFVERIDAAHFGHHVHAHLQGLGMSAAKADGVTAPEEFDFKRRNSDGFSLQFGERLAQAREVRGVSEDGEICVAAKLALEISDELIAAGSLVSE